MKRLTRRSAVGEGLPANHLNLMVMDTTSQDTLTGIFETLAAYEDIGLEPREIEKAVILAKSYIMESLKENERSIAILKHIGADTRQIEAASTGLKNLLIKFEGQQEGELWKI